MNDWLTTLQPALDAATLDKVRVEVTRGKDPADYLVSGGLVSSTAMLAHLSHFYEVPSINLNRFTPEKEAMDKVSEEIARRFNLLPLFLLKKRIYAAVANPRDLMAFDFIRQFTGLTVEPVVAIRSDIEQAINRHYLVAGKTAISLVDFAAQEAQKETAAQAIHLEDEEAPTIKTLNHIIASAVRLGASDIHLEPFADRLLLRYRVDGVLHEFPPPPATMGRALVSRLKILSNMDIAERRLPQDGRTDFTVDNRPYDLRVSIIPNLYGESVVIRILATTGAGKGLDSLGFPPALLAQYKTLINRPYGIMLVTGPTGSGKSTTLYATLKHIFTLEKKIITLEDPVEYQLEGMTQFAVQPDIGFTFARGLRSVLRHDPDVVMLGEIRDQESAEIAIQASLTGHLLFSTLHTNDAPSAATRLIDIGVQPYLVMSSLIGAIAQRLVRVLCRDCKVPYEPSAAQLASVGITTPPPGAAFFKPVGCASCNNLGYKGRMGVFELLEITPEMRRLTPMEMIPDNIQRLGAKHSYVPMRRHALDKWMAGETTLEEILRETGG